VGSEAPRSRLRASICWSSRVYLSHAKCLSSLRKPVSQREPQQDGYWKHVARSRRVAVRLDYLHPLIKLSDFPPILPESMFLLKRLLDLLDLQEMIVFFTGIGIYSVAFNVTRRI
jgi:hypothetical protein